MRKKVIKILLHIFGVLLFIFATAYALLAAYGYQIDLLHQNIVKTSIIDICNEVEDVFIFLDGKLIAERAPFQVKNIKPGLHEIEVMKEGYITWEKEVNVKEDIVSKVDDVLLIPSDIKNISEKIPIDFDFKNVIYNDQYILFISPQENKLHLYKFNNDGTFSVDHINYKLDTFEGDIYFVNAHYIAFSQHHKTVLFNVIDKSTMQIAIPDEFQNFKLAFTNQITGFYLNDNNLFSVDIAEGGSFQKITLLSESINDEKTALDVIESQGQIFITWAENLYHYYDNKLILLDHKIKTAPKASPDLAHIIYLKKGEELVLYNLTDGEKELLARFSYPVQSIWWYKDAKHIFLNKEGTLLLCDLDFANCTDLINVEDEDTLIVFPYNPIFMVIEKEQLKLYNVSSKT